MRRRLLPGIAYLVALAVVVAALVAVFTNHQKTTPGKPTIAVSEILGAGGIMLGAHLYVPPGAGRHPLLIMPASWGSTAAQYRLIGPELAADGYLVVTYAQRGFPTSQGSIDLAGYPTQADASAVITWALRNTSADPNAIGAIGVSYGAGVSLLAAERDPRIKAVVAMSTWTDLQSSFFPNGTPNTEAVDSLFGPAVVPRLAAPVASFARKFAAANFDAAAAQLASLSAIRSPITNVDALNKNHPAVMIANDYQDSYFAPSQLVTFFDKLTGPKRLQLAAGDHGGQETPGLLGQPTKVWSDATARLDHYLRGVNNGIQAQPPVQLQDMTTGEWHTYSSWPATTPATTAVTTAYLKSWGQAITLGAKTVAQSAPIEIGVYPYRPVSGVRLGKIAPTSGAVWNGAVVSAPTPIDGQPSVHVSVTLSTTSASMFAYL